MRVPASIDVPKYFGVRTILALALVIVAASACKKEARPVAVTSEDVYEKQILKLYRAPGDAHSGPLLYVVEPPEGSTYLTAIEYSGGAESAPLRVYATGIARGDYALPFGAAHIPVYQDGVSMPHAEAVLLLTDASTRLIHVGERANLNVHFPDNYGLRVGPDEQLLVEWNPGELTRQVTLTWTRSERENVEIVHRETVERFASDAPFQLTSRLDLDPSEQLIWMSLVTSRNLHTAKMKHGRSALTLIDGTFRSSDMYWNREGQNGAQPQVEVSCVFAGSDTTGTEVGESVCGIFAYAAHK